MNENRVLLVEDEPGYARFLREVLAEAEGSAHELTWVTSLGQGLQQLAESRFDIVLLDLGLPDADGNEALTQVTAAVPAIPIVVLSARHDLEVALESMRLGAQEYLVKGQAENVLLPRAIRYAMERKRLQDAAALARQEAERANAVKDEFLAMLGHELRNPLAPIVTGLELIRQRRPAGMERELTIIERQVHHLVRLVDDLLDVSRIARGKIDLDRAEIDIADVVADGVEAALPLFAAQRHNLTVDVPRNVLFVEADRMRLAQVLSNLLTNAGKYTKPGGNIVLSARAEAGELMLRVRDDGIGMERELLDRAFCPFEQGARPLDRSAGGLGLGLAIVKSIVTLHGGSVSAASEGRDKGSELTVRLPLVVPRRSSHPPAPSSPAVQPSPRALRVLIVDDNVDGASMFEVYLRGLGHTTTAAADGATALRIAHGARLDAALIDIGLPVMDGYELARRLRAELAGATPVLIAVTGYGQDSDRARALEAGFDHHLVKPVQLAKLDALLATVPRQGGEGP